jgi:PBSX family phage terminase large subunit
MEHKIDFRPTKKQDEVFKLFNDSTTTEVVYGGALGAGKSYLIASLLVMKCLQHEGIRIGLARNNITTLKKTTVTSIMEVMQDWGVTGEYYSYNSQAGIIKFWNESEIVLIELDYLPSDPQYTRLGGQLLTFGVIDEAGEVPAKGKEIFQSRIGRWQNAKLNIKPFLLMTCNPSKNFLFTDYYRPYKEDKLKQYQKFIQALPSDNPYLSKEYIENLKNTLSFGERRRLLGGEWEFADDETSLFKYEDVIYAYDTTFNNNTDKTMRLSCDIAFSSDKCVYIIWEGLNIMKIHITPKNDTTTVEQTIKNLCNDYTIRTDNISYDADGVGLYLKQYFPSAKEIHNGGKTILNDGYSNLKTELYFKLSELLKDGKIKIYEDRYQQDIIDELSVIRHKPRESMDNKIQLISKLEMKKILSYSPDIADAMAYGMIFHLKKNTMTASNFVFMNY